MSAATSATGGSWMDRVKLGIVGLGFGVNHVYTAADMEDVQVVAVADNAPKLPQAGGKSPTEFAAEHGAKAYDDGVEMIESEDLDAVSLAVSPKYRLPLMEAVAERGIPMMVKKPFATNIEHGQRMRDLAEKHGATVMVEFPLRYMPPLVRLRELMDTELGRGYVCNGDLLIGWIPPETHGAWDPDNHNGLINENAVHLFDTVCFLMGKPAVVHAEGGSYRGSRLEDGAVLTVRFEGPAVACLVCGGLGARAFNMPTYINVSTENGQAQVTGDDHMFSALRWATHDSAEVRTESWSQPPRSHILQYSLRHFVDCVKSGDRPSVGPEDGIIATAIAMAVRESLERKAPVELAW